MAAISHSAHLGRCFGYKRLAQAFLIMVAARCLISSLSVPRNLVMSVSNSDQTNAAHNSSSCAKFQDIHVVFSTGCSEAQQWQSYIFFYHAFRVGQPGQITRIVSGCTKEQQNLYARKHHDEIVQKMSDKFHIHFTPDFAGTLKGQSYKFFNKPFGLRHWMEHELGYPDQNEKHDDTIIALLDPDMILTKPLVNNFKEHPTHNWYQSVQPLPSCVSHGKPIAQQYFYRNDWVKSMGSRMADIVGNDSQVHNVSDFDAEHYYAPGPPYLLTGRDMYFVVGLWCEFVPKVYPIYPYLLAEMYGYSIAIAHVGLKHQLAFQTAVGEPMLDIEGWAFLDGIAPEEVCGIQNVTNPPTVLHYCQVYSVGPFLVTKYVTKDNFITCDAPLLAQPRKDLAAQYSVRRLWNGSFVDFQDSGQSVRSSFMLCAITEGLNQAATFFKQHHCGNNANFDATFSPFQLNESALQAKL